jgi:energy-converting hydrogenase Eha subunit F
MNATPHLDRSPAGARARALLGRLWRASPPLTAVGLLMIAVAGVSLVGVLVDPRVITGAPAWLKPLKFAVSTAVYSLTLAWIFTYLSDWPRLRRVMGWTTAIVFVLEVALIDTQAWRGTTSHFNAATVLDRTIFAIMGVAIVLQTLVSVAVVVALWRQRFADRALGWALRFGMALTILGAITGPLMTRPTPEQVAELRAGKPLTIVGAHTVGGPDGGPGLPVTGWSREHGDVRVAHFIGLHAVQVLALFALALGRSRRPERVRVRAVLAGTASYAALFGLLLWQALRGQSLVAPDAPALASLVIWAVLTVLVIGANAAGSRRPPDSPAEVTREREDCRHPRSAGARSSPP